MWCKASALAIACTLAASHAAAQTETDLALERLESINGLWLGRLRAPLTFALVGRPSGLGADGAAGASFTLVGLEKRGAAWEALRLDQLQGWVHTSFDLAFTVIDLQQAMIGTNLDHDLCIAAVPVVLLGDCRYGGAFGVHAKLLHHAYWDDADRWFHRWFELGVVWNPASDSFDVDFVQARLPITLGASLDHVTNLGVRLRGLAEVAFVHRFGGFRWELTSSFAFRPALAPFELANDYALEGRIRLGYVWLSALLGSLRGTAQRVYFEFRASHWEEPFRSEQPWLGQNNLQFTLGIELRLRDLTPS